jgi:polynucleotide 5'-kinase involved in rRNA processing
MPETPSGTDLFTLEEKDVFQSILARPGTTMFLGAPDTGKTTMVHKLVEVLANHGPTAIVDSDIGQSSVGPPACVGALRVEGRLGSWMAAERLHFVGGFSPSGHFLPLVEGLIRLTGWARRIGVNHVVVDTTGFVEGGAAVELKVHKVSLTRPAHLVALERYRELQPVLNAVRFRRGMEIYRIKPSPMARLLDAQGRNRYRLEILSRYFQGSTPHAFRIHPALMANPHLWEEARSARDLEGRLVGFLDGQGATLAMGWIRDVDDELCEVMVDAPLRSLAEVAHLRLGRARWTKDAPDRESAPVHAADDGP